MTDAIAGTIDLSPYQRTRGERQKILDDFVVDHDRSREAIEFIKRFHYPVEGGYPGYGRLALLAGDSRTGKSFSVRQYLNSHPTTLGTSGKIFPVAYCEMPAVSTDRAIVEALAEAIQVELRGKPPVYALQSAVLTDLAKRRVQFLVFDEFQDVFDPKKVHAMNFVRKFIRKMLNINSGHGPNILCVGLLETYGLMSVDKQLTGRGGLPCKIIRPYEWDSKEERLLFRYLCGEIDKVLPFERKSGLESAALAEQLYFVTRGNLGLLKDFIRQAGYLAINEGAACIEDRHFALQWDIQKPPDSVNFNPFRDDLSLAPKDALPTRVAKRTLSASEAMSKTSRKSNGNAAVQ